MFRKLTKYEWKAYAKSMFFLLIAVTAITIIAIASIAVLMQASLIQTVGLPLSI